MLIAGATLTVCIGLEFWLALILTIRPSALLA
jgi:hypothetical protein